MSSGSSHFQRSADRGGFHLLVAFAERFMMDHASGIMYAFIAGRQDISGGTAPIEDPARLESRGQVLSSGGPVGMED